MIKVKHGTTNYKTLKPFMIAANKNEGYGKFEADGFMDLVIEKLWYSDIFGNPVYSVAHYGKLNGDAMRDPEITFSVDAKQETVMPLTFLNDYMGIYQEVFTERDGKNLYSKRLMIDLDDFLWTWTKNIKAQGFNPEKNTAIEAE